MLVDADAEHEECVHDERRRERVGGEIRRLSQLPEAPGARRKDGCAGEWSRIGEPGLLESFYEPLGPALYWTLTAMMRRTSTKKACGPSLGT